VGPSGIGKTTLISLVLRFYKPTSGEIFFDGEPASTYEVQSLRRRIGYVAQTTVLLSLPILENLRYGNPDATIKEVRRACKVAGIDAFVEGLPEGLDTVVGPRGINLSEGQSQRLSLARALVKEPDILLFDEPTSAIDLVTERSILESLPAVIRGKTLFIVAHRLSTIRDCSKIILLDENRLIACGTHESLLRTNDYYRLLIEIQRASAVIGAESVAASA
jgi:ABC-type multidrug transport system fused ATPase/permease subunit